MVKYNLGNRYTRPVNREACTFTDDVLTAKNAKNLERNMKVEKVLDKYNLIVNMEVTKGMITSNCKQGLNTQFEIIKLI